MPRTRPTSLTVAATIIVAFPLSFANAQLRLGGFDASRGGQLSLVDGSAVSELRSEIMTAFPDAMLSGSPELTEQYLSDLDALLIACISCIDPDCAITLSPEEQYALRAFVEGGGLAVLFSENDDFDPANQTFIQPFGLVIEGFLGGDQMATVLQPPSHPVTSGPFGTVATLRTHCPGWFTQLGPHATALATLDANGGVCLAVIDPGELSPTSGQVVFLSDSSMILDWEITSSNITLILNSIALSGILPCPGDIDGDGDTDHADLGALLGAWDSQPGDPNWNENADLDGDGQVGHSDLGILLGDWGCGT